MAQSGSLLTLHGMGISTCLTVFILVMSTVKTQADKELAGLIKGATVDFEKDDVYAEILAKTTSGDRQSTTYGPKYSTDWGTASKQPTTGDGSFITTTSSQSGRPSSQQTAPVLAELDTGVLGSLKEGSTLKSTSGNDKNTTELMDMSTMATESKSNVTIDPFFLPEEMPPHVTRPLSQERVIAARNATFHYRCEADGNPEPRFQWYQNGIKLSINGVEVRSFPNGSLVIYQFDDRHNGRYHCTATNKFGTSMSVDVPIVCEKGAAAPVPEKEKVIEVEEGDPAHIYCADTPETIPAYIRRWYLYQDTRELQISERIGTDSNGTLRFAYVEAKDASRYTCALVPTQGATKIQLYNIVTLNVRARRPVQQTPRLEYISKDVKAVLDETVIIDCFFSGFPVPKITWRNTSNHEIHLSDTNYEVMDHGRKLKIIRVRQGDEGKFKCKADNTVGERTETIQVNVTSPPLRNLEEKSGLTTLTEPDQQDVVLNCKARSATGEHLDPPVWYRNGEILTQSNLPYKPRYRFSADYTELHIADLDKVKDTACYQCKVSNSEGYLFMDGYLRVINAINVTGPDRYNKIGPNDVIDISVFATGDACCRVSTHWYLNGTLLTEDQRSRPPFVMDKKEGTQLFNASSVSMETLVGWLGMYTCRISNKYQEVEYPFYISLYDPVTAPVTAGPAEAETSGLWWVAVLCGILALIVVAIVIVVIYKNKNPGETYKLEEQELKHNLNPEEDLLNQSFHEM